MPATRRRLLAAAGAALALPRPAGASGPSGILRRIFETGVLRFGVWLGAPPWGSLDQNGEPDGSEVAIARLLARDMNVRLQVVRLPAAERVAALLADRVDLLAGLPIMPANLQRIAFAAAHDRIAYILVARRDPAINHLQDLAGKRVAMPAGTFAAQSLHDHLPPEATTIFTENAADTLKALLSGDADAAVAHDFELRDLQIAREDMDFIAHMTISTWRMGLSTRLGEPDLLRFLNTFLYLRTRDGSIAEIQSRYFGTAQNRDGRFR